MDDLIVEREFSRDAALYLCRKAMEYFVPGVEDYMEISELLLGCAEGVVRTRLKEDAEAAEKCEQILRDARKLLGMWTEKQLHDPAAAINAAEVLAEMAGVEPNAEQYRRAARFILESEVLDGKRLRDFIRQCEELLDEEPDGTQINGQDDEEPNEQDNHHLKQDEINSNEETEE